MKVQRICQHCEDEFTAQRTTTKYCSLDCARKAYKDRERNLKIEALNDEMRHVFSKSIEEIKVKEFLSIADTSKLLGISKRTIYRMIDRDELHIAKAGTRTILRRSDIDNLFTLPKKERIRKEPQPITEFYTVEEVTEKYLIKYGRLHTIIKENNIPKTIHDGKLHVSKPHIDRYFKKHRDDISSIMEWYTIQEIMEKYDLSRDQIYCRVSRNRIPKQRIGKTVKISKQHFDELFMIGV